MILRYRFIFLLVTILYIQVFAKDEKAAWIDSDQILKEFKGREDMKRKFQSMIAPLQAQATKLQREIITLQKEVRKNQRIWSKKKIEEKSKLLQSKMGIYSKFVKEKFGKNGVAEKEMKKLTAPILKSIYLILKKLAKQGNYSFIFDVRSIPQILYAKPEFSLTNQVIKELNSLYKKQNK